MRTVAISSKPVDMTFGGLAQMRLQFAEGHLDRIEIGRIGAANKTVSRPPLRSLP
jgi:hypothetical protein